MALANFTISTILKDKEEVKSADKNFICQILNKVWLATNSLNDVVDGADNRR